MLPRIFVGGTGRSGTWIVYKTLGSHADVHTFPAEMRFLIDPGGILELVNALSINYSPAAARMALFRFERLMRIYLATPGQSPYWPLDLPGWLGDDFYWEQLDRFCDELVEVEYEGFSWDVDYKSEGRLVSWAKKVRKIKQDLQDEQVGIEQYFEQKSKLREVRYFSNRQELIEKSALFMDTLFLRAAQQCGKKTWCEKTPQHLLTLDFIWEMFPDSVFIHVKRDPRGVAQSLVSQRWAPNDLEQACLWLRNVYQRWFDLKEKLNLAESHYLEIKLEEAAKAPDEIISQVTKLCQLDNNKFSDLPKISLEKVSYWKNTMPKQEIELVNKILVSYIEKLGYEI